MSAEQQVMDYLERWSPVRDPDRERLVRWFRWYWRQGLCVAVQARGQIVGAALLRRVRDAAQAEADPLAHDERAPLLWIEFATCQAGPAGWRALTDCVAVRWPDLPAFTAFHRLGRTDRRAPRPLPTKPFFHRLATSRHG